MLFHARRAYDFYPWDTRELLRRIPVGRSVLEPCEGRGAWLAAHPPQALIVLPRMSFTGEGKTDSVTCAWVVWAREAEGQWIEIVNSGAVRPAHQFRSLPFVNDDAE